MSGIPLQPSAASEGLFRLRPFAFLLGLRVTWTVSIQMLLVGIAWHVYELSGDAWSLALIGLYQFLPVLLFSIPAGYVVDRFNRQRIIAVCMIAHCLTASWLTWLVMSDGAMSTRALYVASVLLGIARSTLAPALQALVPALLPAPLLARGTASVSTASQISIIVGPALAGFLASAGIEYVYATAAMLLFIGLFLPGFMRVNEDRVVVRKVDLQTLLAGFRFIGQRPILFGAILLDLFAVLFGGAVALLPLYVKDILGGGPAELGLLRAAPAAGALAMSVLLILRPLERHVGQKLMLAIGVFGLSTIVFGLSKTIWLSAIALVFNGAADMISVVIRQTLVQLETPAEMRGRVSTVNSLFIGASNQLGEFQAGAAAALVGPVFSVILGGLITASLPFIWRKRFPSLSRRDAMMPPPAQGSANPS